MSDKDEVLNPSDQAQQEISIENLQRHKAMDRHNQRLHRDRQRTSKRRRIESLSDREKRLRLNREHRARMQSKNDSEMREPS